MILVDTSAWVEYDRATNSQTDLRLAKLIAEGGEGAAVSEPVLMEGRGQAAVLAMAFKLIESARQLPTRSAVSGP